MVNDTMRQLAYEQIQRLTGALALTARKEKGAGIGGHVYNLSELVATLNAWIRAYDRGEATFNGWSEAMNKTGFIYDEWYDWYNRTYTRQYDELGGLTVQEWYWSVQQRVLESRIIDLDQGAA